MDAAKTSRTNVSLGTTGRKLTRKRIPLSCVACRIRKLKCNREKPCQNCVVRGESTANSCTYAEKAEGKVSRLNSELKAEYMRNRINRLENSILSMISSDSRDKLSQSTTAHIPILSPQVESENNDQDDPLTTSVDSRSTHWDVILNDLGAMKEAWSEENDYVELADGNTSDSSKSYRPTLLNGMAPPPDRAAVIASLPPKDQADNLISRFFSEYNPALPAKYVVHEATFLKQYETHWREPTKTKIMWIGLLFGILAHAVQSYGRDKEVSPEQETNAALADLYRVRTAQCLTMAQLTKPVKYMVETLLLYSQLEFTEEGESDSGSWLLGGSAVRIAMQQGWHRDPSQYPSISIFDGEMRRRVWTLVSQYDLLLCTKIGIPRSLRYIECDVIPASNLYPEELYEEMTELPPSRDLSEDTPMSYFVMKHRIMRAYGHVIEFLHIVDPPPYSEVLRLDAMIRETREMIPPYLQVRPLDEMMNDSPSRLTERYLLMLFIHKATCLLHRKYWNVRSYDSPEPGTLCYSRKTCVISSMVVLEQQASMHRASQPGGPLVVMKWYHFPIANHDFLLAAMILCLDLMGLAADPNLQCDHMVTTLEKLDYIQRSRGIWADIVNDCKDAKKAVCILDKVITIIKTKFEEMGLKYPIRVCPLSGLTINNSLNNRLDPANQWGVNTPPISEHFLGDDALMQDNFSPSGGIIDFIKSSDMSAEFDWDAWDQLIANGAQASPLGIPYE